MSAFHPKRTLAGTHQSALTLAVRRHPSQSALAVRELSGRISWRDQREAMLCADRRNLALTSSRRALDCANIFHSRTASLIFLLRFRAECRPPPRPNWLGRGRRSYVFVGILNLVIGSGIGFIKLLVPFATFTQLTQNLFQGACYSFQQRPIIRIHLVLHL